MHQKLAVKATVAAIIHAHHGATLNLAAIASIIPTPTSTSTNPSPFFSETILQNDGYQIHRHVGVSIASIILTQLQHQPIYQSIVNDGYLIHCHVFVSRLLQNSG